MFCHPVSRWCVRGVWVGVLGALLAVPALAARPSETLLPNTTKGYFSVGNVETLIHNFNQTQLGQLAQDPVMEPFTEDLKRQIRNKWLRVHNKLGVSLEDLREVPSGEVCLAVIQPDKKQGAVAVLADVTGRLEQAGALLAKIDRNMQARQATKREREVLGAKIIHYTLKPTEEHKQPSHAVFFLNENMLCAVDNLAVAEAMLGRFTGRHDDTLENLPAFRAVIDRVQEASGGLGPDARWFCEPFGYLEAMRAIDPSRRKRGKDLLKILASQGFTAIQGVGGHVNFDVEQEQKQEQEQNQNQIQKYEILHRTAIYAPPLPDVPKEEKYRLAARMLQFPNGGPLHPQHWVPRELATYVSGNWEVRQAFEYSKTLVDAVIGDKGVFDDVLRSIETDPNGPKVNIRKDLIAYLGTRCTLVSDYELPITPKCERMVFGVETTNAPALAATIEKIMQSDPNAHRREVGEHVVWEIIDEQDELPTVEIEDAFDPIGAGKPKVAEEKRKLPNSAVTVAHDHLLIATHIDFLRKVLAESDRHETLGSSADYQLVMRELAKLDPNEMAARIFSRTEEEFRPTYELIRMGKMPESETIFGQVLNAVLGEGKEGERRAQQIDGSQMPPFEMVRRYFGPSGLTVHSEPAGWLVTGAILTK